jgi:hypothetical protein
MHLAQIADANSINLCWSLSWLTCNQLLPCVLLLLLLVQIVVTCLLTQMNYLNKALDLFNTAIVSPIYYVMFTLLTIVASVIMFQVGAAQCAHRYSYQAVVHAGPVTIVASVIMFQVGAAHSHTSCYDSP